MPYIKLLTVLTTLALLTACGGGTADKAGGNATDCKTNAFHDDCLTDTDAIKLRQDMCLEDATTNPLCTGEAGIVTVFCTANPFEENCIDEIAYDVVRTPLCIADKTTNNCTDTITRVCTDDPFATLCAGESNYNDARLRACSADATTRALTKCAPTVVRVCPHALFINFCADDPNYNDTRRMACLPDPTSDLCAPTAMRICTDDPFDDVFCAGDSDYNTARETICLTETTSTRCMPTVDRVCTANVYDDVCNGTSYADSRSLVDSLAEIGMRNCATRPIGDARCAELSEFVCEQEPLETVCDRLPAYSGARRAECLEGDRRTSDPLCVTTVRGVCTSNVLDTLCDGIETYASLQASACRDESTISKPECATTLTRVCGNLEGTSATGDPFNLTCGNAVFQDARNAISLACGSDASGRLCVSERNQICGSTPFNDVCKRSEYLPLQIRACIGEEATGNCIDDTFFTDSVILGCLSNPFDVACTMSSSTFAPYVLLAQDTSCLASGTLAGCVNPTAVFGTTLPSEPNGVLNGDTSPATPYKSGFLVLEASNIDTTTDTLDLSTFTLVPGQFDNISFLSNVIIRRNSGATDNSDSDDGVAYFNTDDNEDGAAYSYGGILPTTNLGAPLVAPAADALETTAIWGGHFSYQKNPKATNAAIDFWVDFAKGTIGFANAGNDGAGTHTISSAGAFIDFILNGTFGSNAKLVSGDIADPTKTAITLSQGQLGGSVYYAFGTTSGAQDNKQVTTSGYHELHGLIGQEGVVGVFTITGNRPANLFVGGFTASNPDHPNNK